MPFSPHKSLRNRKHFSTGYCSGLDSTFFPSLGVLKRCHLIWTVANLSPKQRNMQSFSRHVETSPCSCNGLSAHLHPFTRCNLLEATLSSVVYHLISTSVKRPRNSLPVCWEHWSTHHNYLQDVKSFLPLHSFSLLKKEKKKAVSISKIVSSRSLCSLIHK